MSAIRSQSAAALACLLASCSFTGLDQYDLKPCTPRAPCAEANAGLPAGQCEEYVCDESGLGCVLKPRDRDQDDYPDEVVCKDRKDVELDCDDDDDKRHDGLDEICDGIDNDCDDWIDEDSEPETELLDAVPIDSDPVYMNTSVADDDTRYFALTYKAPPERQNELLVLIGGELTSDTFLGETDCTLEGGKGRKCNFRQLAIAAAPETLFGAGINYGGCGHGQLKVGLSRGSDFPVLGRSDEGASAAIDIDLETGCTDSTGCPGASQPVIAALPNLGSAPAQALVVWQAPLQAPECDGSSAVQVSAAGVLRNGTSIDVTGGGSAPLGVGVAGDPAAAVAWPGPGAEGGYFVAFAEDERLELRFIPRLDGAESELHSRLVAGSIATLGASNVALALDDGASDAPRGLGVAYRATNRSRTVIAFAPLDFDAAEGFATAHAPIEFETTEPIISGPTLAFARHGFVENADARKTGGWLLTWIEGAEGGARRLMAARIAQVTTHRLGPPIVLARGALSWPFTHSKRVEGERDELHYGFVEDAQLQLHRLSCNRLQ